MREPLISGACQQPSPSANAATRAAPQPRVLLCPTTPCAHCAPCSAPKRVARSLTSPDRALFLRPKVAHSFPTSHARVLQFFTVLSRASPRQFRVTSHSYRLADMYTSPTRFPCPHHTLHARTSKAAVPPARHNGSPAGAPQNAVGGSAPTKQLALRRLPGSLCN